MCEMIIGDDPMAIEAIVAKLKRQTGTIGPGMFNFALSGVDVALWDIKGKAFGLPVATLLGGHRDRVPTYASGQLTRDRNLEFLADVGHRLVEKGFRQMKTQMGAEPNAEDEVARIRVMREAIGPDIDLMCDVNQLWDVNRAITIGKQVEEYNLFWLEDLTTYDDYQGLARIADALTTLAGLRRVRIRYRPLPPADREPVHRHCHDRPDARRRNYPVPEGGGNGRGFQYARGQPRSPGGTGTQRGRHPQRPDSGVHALVPAAVRGNAGHR